MAADEDGKQQEKKSTETSWATIATVVAGVIAVLGFLGISNAAQLGRFVASDRPASSGPTYDRGATSDDETSTADSEEPTSSAGTTSEESDSSSGDSAPSDGSSDTPFTWDALLTSRFTTDSGPAYALESAGGKPCGQAYGMSDGVAETLTGYGCTGTMVGTYLVDSDTVTDENQILVSVQVVSFAGAEQARGAYDSFRDDGTWEFGIWCPRSVLGKNACSEGYESSSTRQLIRLDERYLIAATAVYTSLNSVEPWVTEAAQAAAAACGPQ